MAWRGKCRRCWRAIRSAATRSPSAGRPGDLMKLLWWGGDGLYLFAKRLKCVRFVWPRTEQGEAVLDAAGRHRLAPSGAHPAARGGREETAGCDSGTGNPH